MCIIQKPFSFLLERPESIGIARTHRQNDPSEERGQALAAEQEKTRASPATPQGKTEKLKTDGRPMGCSLVNLTSFANLTCAPHAHVIVTKDYSMV